MHIGQICTRKVVTCPCEANALELARLMRDRHVGDLIVVVEHEGGFRPVGVITDRDLIVLAMARGRGEFAIHLTQRGVLAADGGDIGQRDVREPVDVFHERASGKLPVRSPRTI